MILLFLDSALFYCFVFNYREDYEGDDAYILSNGINFFIIVGKQNSYEYLELNTISIDVEDEDSTQDDDLDFSMF